MGWLLDRLGLNDERRWVWMLFGFVGTPIAIALGAGWAWATFGR